MSGKGFIACAVACSAFALAVYAGLFEALGVPATGAIFVLLALCLLFHGASIYMLRGAKRGAGGQGPPPAPLSSRKEDRDETKAHATMGNG